jgi:hypothetical protein
MKSPERIALTEFRKLLDNFFYAECTHDPVKKQLVCTACMNDIRVVLCSISLHAEEFDKCAGPGTVVQMLIPYCIVCERPPEVYGCVHMPYGQVRNLFGM